MASRSNEVEQPGQLDDETVVVVLVERMLVQVFRAEFGLQGVTGDFLRSYGESVARQARQGEKTGRTYVVLFHNLHEAGKVELGIQGEIVHVGNECRHFLLHVLERLIIRCLTPRLILIICSIILIVRSPIQGRGVFSIL